jgi:DNA-binding transcriptional LysR family regulator
MTTFKQLEALICIIDSGSFEKAATTLQIAQSAVSKHIHDLEEQFGYALFDRRQRSARLTVEGNEILHRARSLIQQRDLIDRRLKDSAIVPQRLRIGVTELTAMTWLPAWIDAIRQNYPDLEIVPTQASQALLKTSLLSGQLDIIAIPEVASTAGLISKVLQDVRFAWVCRRDIGIPGKTTLQKVSHPLLLLQDSEWASAYQLKTWIASLGGNPAKIISSESLQILLSMCFSGYGLAFLPQACVEHWIRQGLLEEIQIAKAKRKLKYAVCFRTDSLSIFHEKIADIASAQCNFRQSFSDFRADLQRRQ